MEKDIREFGSFFIAFGLIILVSILLDIKFLGFIFSCIMIIGGVITFIPDRKEQDN